MQETTILLQTIKNAKLPMNKGRLAFLSKTLHLFRKI